MAKDFFEHVARRFPPKVIAKGRARYRELRREMLLRELHEALKVPQNRVAKATGIRQQKRYEQNPSNHRASEPVP